MTQECLAVQMRNVDRRTVRGTLWCPKRAWLVPESKRGVAIGARNPPSIVAVRLVTNPVRTESGVPETGVAGASPQQQLIDRVEGHGAFCCGQCDPEPVFGWLALRA